MTIAAVLAAAGRGVRAGGLAPKQYRAIGGRAVIAWSLEALRASGEIDEIVAVIGEEDRALYEAALGARAPRAVIGGANRQESVRAGLEALTETGPDLVLIHDAARPFASPHLIREVVAAAREVGAAVPGLTPIDALWRAAGDRAVEGLAREGLMAVQTPQAFRFAAILAAHRAAEGGALADDATVARAAGLEVAITPGEAGNFKLTTPADFARAEAILAAEGRARALRPRTGFGFDVHRFEPGDHVMLGGVAIPHDQGLQGFSDADVGLHALTDAVLGAGGLGDIGQHFPPGDARWRGASSDRFLAHAAALIGAHGGLIAHVDLTIVAERPKIGPHRATMRARIGEILGLGPDAVSVKATTTEGLGFTGRREGIAAQAVATVMWPAP